MLSSNQAELQCDDPKFGIIGYGGQSKQNKSCLIINNLKQLFNNWNMTTTPQTIPKLLML